MSGLPKLTILLESLWLTHGSGLLACCDKNTNFENEKLLKVRPFFTFIKSNQFLTFMRNDHF